MSSNWQDNSSGVRRQSDSSRERLGRAAQGLGSSVMGLASLRWLGRGEGGRERSLPATIAVASLVLFLVVSVGARGFLQPGATAVPSETGVPPTASAPAVAALPTAVPTATETPRPPTATPTRAATATSVGLQVTRNATFSPGGSLPSYPLSSPASGSDGSQPTARPIVQNTVAPLVAAVPTETRTPVPTLTPTETRVPTPTLTPSPTPLASAQITFNPSAAKLNEKVHIWVTSAAPYINVRMEGPFDPQYIAAWQTSTGYIWRWEVTPRQVGRFLYQFTAADGKYLLVYGYLDVTAGATPTATVANRPPTSPSSPSPTHATTNVPVAPSLAWAASTDPDAGSTITYKVYFGTATNPTDLLADCNGVNTSFCVPTSIGNLAEGTTYYWKVEARDNIGASTTGPIWMFTTTGNVAPTDITLSHASVAENLAAGTQVGVLSAVDPSVVDTHTYTLVAGEGSTDNASFTIDVDTLHTAAIFNFEAKASYSIRVRAVDGGGLAVEKPFTITVTDVAEAASVQATVAVTATAEPTPTATATAVPTVAASATP